MARRPETLFRAEFFAVDRPTYTSALIHGAASIIESYSNYLIVGQRLLVFVVSPAPPFWAPVVGNGLALIAMATVAVFLASHTMSSVAPEPVVRLRLAIAFVALLSGEYGTPSCIQW